MNNFGHYEHAGMSAGSKSAEEPLWTLEAQWSIRSIWGWLRALLMPWGCFCTLNALRVLLCSRKLLMLFRSRPNYQVGDLICYSKNHFKHLFYSVYLTYYNNPPILFLKIFNAFISDFFMLINNLTCFHRLAFLACFACFLSTGDAIGVCFLFVFACGLLYHTWTNMCGTNWYDSHITNSTLQWCHSHGSDSHEFLIHVCMKLHD